MTYQELNPYTLGPGIMWRQIYFEGTPVGFTIRRSDAHEVVALLNTAYNLGFNTGRIYGEPK